MILLFRGKIVSTTAANLYPGLMLPRGIFWRRVQRVIIDGPDYVVVHLCNGATERMEKTRKVKVMT